MGEEVETETMRAEVFNRCKHALYNAGWCQDLILVKTTVPTGMREIEAWCCDYIGRMPVVTDLTVGENNEWRYWIISDWFRPGKTALVGFGFRTLASSVMFRLRWSEQVRHSLDLPL